MNRLEMNLGKTQIQKCVLIGYTEKPAVEVDIRSGWMHCGGKSGILDGRLRMLAVWGNDGSFEILADIPDTSTMEEDGEEEDDDNE